MSRILGIGVLGWLILLLHLGAVFALDVPHSAPEGVGCPSCHTLHNSLGPNLTNQPTNSALCKSCHTFTGTASALPFTSSDQAKPGISGTSHSWTGLMPAVSNPLNAYGLRATADLTNSAVKQRVSESGNAVICSACHDEHNQLILPWDPLAITTSRGQIGSATGGTTATLNDSSKSWTVNQWANATVKITSGPNNGMVRRVLSNTPTQLTFGIPLANAVSATDSYYLNSGRHFMRILNSTNQLCLDCHFYRNQNDVRTYTGKPLSHPVNKTLAATKDPTQFFSVPVEPASAGFVPQGGTRGELNGGTDTNLKNNIALAQDLGILCLSCHQVHFSPSSDGNILRRPREEICHACHKTDVNAPNDSNSIKTHNSINTDSVKWSPGGWGIAGGKYGEFKCTTCHAVHGTKNVFLIKETITAPNAPADNLPGGAVDFRSLSGTAGTTPGLMGDDTEGHAASSRVCETCHSLNSYHNADSANNTGDLAHMNAQECTFCHSHKIAFKAGYEVGQHTATLGTGYVELFDGHDYLSGSVGIDVQCGMCHSPVLGKDHGSRCSTCHQSPRNSFSTWNKSCQQGGCHTTYHGGSLDAHYEKQFGDCNACHGMYWDVTPTSCLNCHSAFNSNDTTAPVTTSNALASYDGAARIHFSITDGGKVGVGTTYRQLDGGKVTTGSNLVVSTPGAHALEFWSVDQSGNVETVHKHANFTITQDTTPPVTTSNAQASYWSPAGITLTATDESTGGVKATYYKLDGGPTQTGTYIWVAQVSGTVAHVLTFWSEDWSGNVEEQKTVNFTITGGTGTIRLVWGDSDTSGPPGLGCWARWTIRSGTFWGPVVATGEGQYPGWSGVDDTVVAVSPTPYYVVIDWTEPSIWWDDQTVFGDVMVTVPGGVVRLSY